MVIPIHFCPEIVFHFPETGINSELRVIIVYFLSTFF